MFENYKHLGKEKWEIYANIVRKIYAEVGGIEEIDMGLRDMKRYIKAMRTGIYDPEENIDYEKGKENVKFNEDNKIEENILEINKNEILKKEEVINNVDENKNEEKENIIEIKENKEFKEERKEKEGKEEEEEDKEKNDIDNHKDNNEKKNEYEEKLLEK